MSLVVLVPPQEVSLLAEAKAQLIVEHDEDDTYIARLIQAAVGMIDGPNGRLGRCVLVQTLEATFDEFGAKQLIWLPCPPFIEVVSIAYDDLDDAEVTLSPQSYALRPERGVTFRGGSHWPRTNGRAGSVRITYRAGYPAGMPAPIRQAVLGLVAHWYANREPVAEKAMSEVPLGFDDLLAPYVVPVV